MILAPHDPTSLHRRFDPARLMRRLHIDVPLALTLAALLFIAFVVLYSASGQDLAVLKRQGLHVLIASGVLLFFAQIPPRTLKTYSPLVYAASLALLLAVAVLGAHSKGAQRWLDLGLLRFQPSELAKIATPLMVAWYLAEHPIPPGWKHLAAAIVLTLAPAALIARQPDLGTALLVASAGGAVLYFAGLPWKLMARIGLLLAAAAPVLWRFLHGYQQDRVRTFLDPEADPMGRGYHIIQSKIAIGSGGLFGKGWLNGTQARLEFLPEKSTDFIFAVLAEEFGLLGCLTLLGVYLILIARCLYIAASARDRYARLVAGGLALTFSVYVFVNMGMVVGLLPVVGVPLPLVSYGGTSMVTLMACFGVLMSIHTHKSPIA